jgi:hypothetical protein
MFYQAVPKSGRSEVSPVLAEIWKQQHPTLSVAQNTHPSAS